MCSANHSGSDEGARRSASSLATHVSQTWLRVGSIRSPAAFLPPVMVVWRQSISSRNSLKIIVFAISKGGQGAFAPLPTYFLI